MDAATITLITDVISKVGFPIFVAVWMLIYMNKTLKELTDSINRLATLIESRLK